MRAAIITGPGRCEVIEVPSPEPGPGQVRIRLEGCGVCASNLEPWAGPSWMQFPTQPGGLGHEGWGRIDAIGEGVVGFVLGDRVAALSYHAYAEQDTEDRELHEALREAAGGGEDRIDENRSHQCAGSSKSVREDAEDEASGRRR